MDAAPFRCRDFTTGPEPVNPLFLSFSVCVSVLTVSAFALILLIYQEALMHKLRVNHRHSAIPPRNLQAFAALPPIVDSPAVCLERIRRWQKHLENCAAYLTTLCVGSSAYHLTLTEIESVERDLCANFGELTRTEAGDYAELYRLVYGLPLQEVIGQDVRHE